MKKPTTKNHSEVYFSDTNGVVSDEVLIDWYERCQPVGSGPIGMCRMLCAMIEQIAMQRGLELPPPKGLK